MTSHRTYNPGGPMPLASDNAETARAKFAAAGQPLAPYPAVFERPPRASEMVRCPLPNIAAHGIKRVALENTLVKTFGGFTSYPMTGAWLNPRGETMLESGIIYEIAYDAPDADKREAARALFLTAGRDIDEEWTRIEIHQLETRCAQTNLSADEREQDERNAMLRRRERENRPWNANGC